MKQHHVIISGTGRAGTTLLIQLFTNLGLDTGFANDGDHFYQTCNAGLEGSLTAKNAPYILKNPAFCETLEDALAAGNYHIDHAFIPVRDLFSAAKSRIKVSAESPRDAIPEGLSRPPGGMWGTKNKSKQEDILARKFFQLIYTILRYDIPHTFLDFPRLALDTAYTYEKLKPVLKNVGYEEFEAVFQTTSKPNLINTFEANGTDQHNFALASQLRNLSHRFLRRFNRS